MESNNKLDSVAERWRWLVQKLLGQLSAMAAAGSSDAAADFRAELGRCSSDLQNIHNADTFDAAARKCLALCQDYFEAGDSYRLKQEAEYGAIIDVLREALNALAGQGLVSGTVLSSLQRFREMAQVEDLGSLKKKIQEEVQSLEQAVQERQNAQNRAVEALSKRVDVLEHKLVQTNKRLTQTEVENALDSLTRISNRRHFDMELQRWINHHEHGPFVLAMIDVDDFKRINDQHGHQVGDCTLQAIAHNIRLIIRNEDVLARYGGEEFALLLNNIHMDRAEARCNRILDVIRSHDFEYVRHDTILKLKLSVSCGLTEFVAGDTAQDLLHRADRALYQAKRSGKDRIEIRRSTREPNPSATPYQH